MYEAIERQASDFNNLQQLLADRGAETRIDLLCRALEESATQVGNEQGGTEIDRSNRAKIYRGLLAARRIVMQLREHEMAK
jgi:hypothetical protein